MVFFASLIINLKQRHVGMLMLFGVAMGEKRLSLRSYGSPIKVYKNRIKVFQIV